MCINSINYPNFPKSDLCIVHFLTNASNWTKELDSIDSSSVYSVIDGISGWGDKSIEKTLKELHSCCRVTNQEEFYKLCKTIITTEDNNNKKEAKLKNVFSMPYSCDAEKLSASVTFLDGLDVLAIYFEYDGKVIEVYIIDSSKFASINRDNPSLYSVALQSNIYDYYRDYAASTSASFKIKVT